MCLLKFFLILTEACKLEEGSISLGDRDSQRAVMIDPSNLIKYSY